MTMLKFQGLGFVVLHILTFLISVLSIRQPHGPEVDIAAVIKKTLIHKSRDEVTLMMKRHLVQMRLLSWNNIWADKQLESIGQSLLPRNIDGRHLAGLVDKMAENVAKNPYLHNFLSQAGGPDFSQLFMSVKLEGDIVFPDVAAYAMVLDRLNWAMKNDWRVLEACHQIWSKDLSNKNLLKITSPFVAAKIVSVKLSIDELVKQLKDKKAYANSGRYGLPVNILEAKAADIELGYLDNARVAWTLAKNGPFSVHHSPFTKDPFTGSGPTTLSKDGKTLLFHMPLAKEWDDLYQTWNLAFVSHFEEFPYMMAKLLIPSVSGYQSEPEGYMHSRGMALNAHINWFIQGILGTGVQMNWATRKVTKDWGRSNEISRKEYESKLAKSKSSFIGNVKQYFGNIV